jgi:hypothetical protein
MVRCRNLSVCRDLLSVRLARDTGTVHCGAALGVPLRASRIAVQKSFPNVEAAGVEDEARAAQKRHEVAAAGNPPPFVVLRSRLERGPSRGATPRTRKEIYLLQVGT